MARGHRLNTSIALAAVHGLSGLFRAVSEVEPSLFHHHHHPPTSLIMVLDESHVYEGAWALGWRRPAQRVRNRCTGGVSLGVHQYLGAPTKATLSAASLLPSDQSSGAVWESRWPSWAPVPNKPTVSVDVKQHLTAYRPKGTWTYLPIQWPERCVSVKHISGMWYQLLLLFLTQPPAALPAINLQLIRFVLYNLLRCLKSICCKPNQLLRQLNGCVICFACSGTVASAPL